MADKTLRLKLYAGAKGPVAYDAQGRIYATRKDGDGVAPEGVTGPWAIVDRFADPTQKKGA